MVAGRNRLLGRAVAEPGVLAAGDGSDEAMEEVEKVDMGDNAAAVGVELGLLLSSLLGGAAAVGLLCRMQEANAAK